MRVLFSSRWTILEVASATAGNTKVSSWSLLLEIPSSAWQAKTSDADVGAVSRAAGIIST